MDMQKTVTVIIFIVIAFVSGLWYGQGRSNKQLAELRDSIATAEDTNRELESSIQRIVSAYSELEKQLDNYRDRVRQQQAIIDAITKGIEVSGGTIAEIDDRNIEAQRIVRRLLQALTGLDDP